MSKSSLITVLCAAALLQACGSSPSASVDGDPAKTALVSEVQDSAGAEAIALGKVRASRLAVVSSEQGGRIIELLANVGDRVSAGQPLARLDPTPARLREQQAGAELQRAEAVAQERQRNATRLAALHRDGVATEVDLEAAEAEARAARAVRDAAAAGLMLAERDLQETVLRAPIAGVIAARPIDLSMLAPGAAAFEIDGEDGRRIHAVLPTALADALQPGTRVTFAYGQDVGAARLTGVSARDSGAGGREAVFVVTSGSPPPGGIVDLRLSRVPSDGVHVVPLAAVLTDRRGQQAVRMVGPENKLRDVPVRLLATRGDMAEVTGRLAPGQLVVVAGAEFLQAGTTVRPRVAQR